MTDADIAAGLAICDAATVTGWEIDETDRGQRDFLPRVVLVGYHGGPLTVVADQVRPRDATFIAYARTALPLALEELREMKAERDQFRRQLDAQQQACADHCITETMIEERLEAARAEGAAEEREAIAAWLWNLPADVVPLTVASRLADEIRARAAGAK